MGKILYFKKRGGGRLNISVFDVARMFLFIESMTNKKLQKLCYYAQAWFLTLSGQRLFLDNIEAWVHGPVIPRLYFWYREWGGFPINQEQQIPENISNNPQIKNFLYQIYNIYGNRTGDQLEALTHVEQPWLNARKGLLPSLPSNNIIRDQDMIEFYSQKLS